MLGSKAEVSESTSPPTLLPLAVTVGFLVFLVTSGTPGGINGIQGFFMGLVGTLILGSLLLFIDSKNEQKLRYQDDLNEMRKTLSDMRRIKNEISDIPSGEMVITCQHCENKIHVSFRRHHQNPPLDQD